MLKLADPNTAYEVEVTVDVPLPDGGTDPQPYTALFRYPTSSQLTALIKGAQDRISHEADIDLVRNYMAGWRGIVNHKGKELAFNSSNLETLCDIRYWREATATALLQWALALPAKNLEPLPVH